MLRVFVNTLVYRDPTIWEGGNHILCSRKWNIWYGCVARRSKTADKIFLKNTFTAFVNKLTNRRQSRYYREMVAFHAKIPAIKHMET